MAACCISPPTCRLHQSTGFTTRKFLSFWVSGWPNDTCIHPKRKWGRQGQISGREIPFPWWCPKNRIRKVIYHGRKSFTFLSFWDLLGTPNTWELPHTPKIASAWKRGRRCLCWGLCLIHQCQGTKDVGHKNGNNQLLLGGSNLKTPQTTDCPKYCHSLKVLVHPMLGLPDPDPNPVLALDPEQWNDMSRQACPMTLNDFEEQGHNGFSTLQSATTGHWIARQKYIYIYIQYKNKNYSSYKQYKYILYTKNIYIYIILHKTYIIIYIHT